MHKTLAIIGFALLAKTASADLSIDSPLSFGEISVRHNSGVSSTSVTRLGAQSSSHQIRVIRTGTPGIYTLSGLPPYTTINLAAPVPVLSEATYPGARFSIDAVDIPSSVRTDASGSVQFRVGATLSTSGDPAENYQSAADYLIFVNIDMTY